VASVLVNAGRAIITNRIIGSGTEPKYVSWGTGAGTAAATDTTLFTEAASNATVTTDNVRVTGTGSRVTTSVTNDTHRVVGTLTAETGKTITNAGIFDSDGAQATPAAPSGGNLYVKGDFTGIALNTGDSIAFTINLQLT